MHAGDAFICKVRLADKGLSRATTIAVATNSSDVRLPATINPPADQRSVKFRGTVDSAAPQSVVTISVGNPGGNPGDQIEDRIAVLASPAPVFRQFSAII